ncbi:MAG: hypothetical protein Q8920_00760 [Bacillota bacterium]|nr:hypothetical protein [Bacillota bacterium]
MQNIKSLKCCSCKSVILNLPETEISKLNGLTFLCECCGHRNILTKFKFRKGKESDPLLNIFSVESFVD